MRSVRFAFVPWLAALCAGLLAVPRATAQEEIPPVDASAPVSPPVTAGAVIGAVGGEDDVTRSVLVGPGGQVYEPGVPGTWQRQTAGGIGPAVVGAVRVGQTLFAHGAETPVFRRQDAVWHAHPLPNRGRCAMGTGSVPALAIARYVYTWPEGNAGSAGSAGNAARGRFGWTRLATLAGVVTAVWAQTPTRVIAATAQGMLWRVQGSAATAIPDPLAAGDRVVVLTGTPRSLYGLSQSGAVLRIGERRATLVDKPPALAGWVPQVVAVDAGGALWALGWVPARGAEPVRAVLARSDGKNLLPVENIADLLPLDRFLVLHIDRRGGMLWSTQSGAVRYRPAGPTGTPGTTDSGGSAGLGPSGAAWQAAQVISELSLPVPSFPGRGPAVAR